MRITHILYGFLFAHPALKYTGGCPNCGTGALFVETCPRWVQRCLSMDVSNKSVVHGVVGDSGVILRVKRDDHVWHVGMSGYNGFANGH